MRSGSIAYHMPCNAQVKDAMSDLPFLSRRSSVYGRRSIVAASQPLAVAAGLEILAAGGTAAADGGGSDVWIGSRPERQVTGIICSVDLLKRDAKMKILVGCTPAEASATLASHDSGGQSAILWERLDGDSPHE